VSEGHVVGPRCRDKAKLYVQEIEPFRSDLKIRVSS
jgi:hypothetical protein